MADYLIGIKEHIKRRNDNDNRLVLNKLLNSVSSKPDLKPLKKVVKSSKVNV